MRIANGRSARRLAPASVLTLLAWLATSAVSLVGSTGAGAILTAKAAAIPAQYSHSWYITNPDASTTGAMHSLGYGDGGRDNICYTAYVVLDFGQIGNESTAGYSGYGTYRHDTNGDFTPLRTVQAAVEAYATGWYSDTGSCPRLRIVVGANSFHMCPFGNARGACDPGSAGTQWSRLMYFINTDLNTANESWQITAISGGDFETSGYLQGWDCHTRAEQFTSAYNSEESALSRSDPWYDYGDAWGDTIHHDPYNTGTWCWADGDINTIAYKQALNWPTPENYNTNGAAVNAWMRVNNDSGSMDFIGVMTECNVQGDPLPPTTCTVGNHQENAPAQAWNQFNNVHSSDGLYFMTNIKFQP